MSSANRRSDKKIQKRPKRAYFSEVCISTKGNDYATESPVDLIESPPFCPMFTWQVHTEEYAPLLKTIGIARSERNLEPAQKWIKFSGRPSMAFPVQTIRPKVQLVHEASPGQLSREVEVDRRRKMYTRTNLKESLLQQGVELWQLVPIDMIEPFLTESERTEQMFTRNGFFPLEWFDNEDFDSMTPEGWLSLGVVDGVKHPIPAEAFLPNSSVNWEAIEKRRHEVRDILKTPQVTNTDEKFEDNENARNYLYVWTKVAARDYNKETGKWTVIHMDTQRTYEIPRIYLMFAAENPQNFVNRIKNALEFRSLCETRMKYELVTDCLILSGISTINKRLMDVIVSKIPNRFKNFYPEWVSDLQMQINLNYQRMLASIDFKHYMLHNRDKHPFIEIPPTEAQLVRPLIVGVGRARFDEVKVLIRRSTIFYKQESINAMYKVAAECRKLETMSLFTYSFGKTATLGDFISTQQYTCGTVLNYLKGFWLENMAGQICMCLRGVGKGWLDISVRDWGVYMVSKMFCFMVQVKYRMRDALQCFLKTSIGDYCKLLCEPCKSILDVSVDFEWGDNIVRSPFVQMPGHIFYLTLKMAETGAYYSTDPAEFEHAVLKILDDALLQSCAIYQIDSNVMTGLVFAKKLYLPSIGMLDAYVESERSRLQMNYQKAIVPLHSYAKKYDQFRELYLLNVSDYIKAFAGIKKPSQEVKEEINRQIRLKETLEVTLPSTIVIGPFLVNVEPLKQYLINKRRDIINKLLDYFAERLVKATGAIVDQFKAVMGKISSKVSSIEHLYAIRDFIVDVPDTVYKLEEQVKLMLLEYDILDYFLYNLKDDDFSLKWAAVAWPHRILQQISMIHETLEQDVENFSKIQSGDIINFEERIESINEEIADFARQIDASKAVDISVDIKKTWKIITDMEKESKTLQARQALLELPPFDGEIMEKVVRTFTPYRLLWTTCADFLILKEVCFSNPLTNIDIVEIRSAVTEMADALNECRGIFIENAELQQVADFYLDKINEFTVSLEIISWLKSPYWTVQCWQELAKRAKVDIKYSLSIYFRYCIEKGILDHGQIVREIGEKATLDAIDEESNRIASRKQNGHRQTASEELMGKRIRRRGRTDI